MVCDGVWPEILSAVTDVSSWGLWKESQGLPQARAQSRVMWAFSACASGPSAPSTSFPFDTARPPFLILGGFPDSCGLGTTRDLGNTVNCFMQSPV